jgi:hypothetical protein
LTFTDSLQIREFYLNLVHFYSSELSHNGKFFVRTTETMKSLKQ